VKRKRITAVVEGKENFYDKIPMRGVSTTELTGTFIGQPRYSSKLPAFYTDKQGVAHKW